LSKRLGDREAEAGIGAGDKSHWLLIQLTPQNKISHRFTQMNTDMLFPLKTFIFFHPMHPCASVAKLVSFPFLRILSVA
jgi:hypothetical protein